MINLSDTQKFFAKVIALVLIACLSFFLLAPRAASVEKHFEQIEYLNEKKNDVLGMTTITTAASLFISLAPGDAATPIAEQLAELGDYFVIILAALYFEKFMITIFGAIVFKLIIPAVCVGMLVNMFTLNNVTIKNVGIKLIVFALAAYCVIPSGVKLSQMVEETNVASIKATMDAANQTVEDIKAAQEDEEGTNGIVKFFKNIGGTATSAGAYAKAIFNNTIDAISVLFVTALLIPIITALAFIPLTKIIMGIDIQPKLVEMVDKVKAKHPLSGSLHLPKLKSKE